MNPDPDEQLGDNLDSYLRSLESGQSIEPEQPTSDEASELRGLVHELHLLAKFLASPDRASEVAATPPTNIGKYKVRQPLGEGGQSRTWLADDPDLERPVVVKLYRDAETATQRERVLREARALARVNSPFVARCFDADRHGDHPFLVVEYIAGSPLDRFTSDHPLEISHIVELIKEIAEGLSAVHASGLIHRDVKPANIIIGDDRRPRIVDFGMAHIKATPVSSISGTPAYMAPEQARGEIDRIDNRTDVFGVGAVLYELLTGRAPFHRETREQTLQAAREGTILAPDQLNPSVPKGLNQICMRCLAKEPVNRFSTVDELRRALGAWQSTLRLKRSLPVVLAAVSLASLSLLLWSSGFHRQSPNGQSQNRKATLSSVSQFAPDALPDDALDFFAIGGQLRKDFWMQVDILGAPRSDSGVIELDAGDRIAFRIESERDCYVTILSYGPDAPEQLFPRAPFDRPDDGQVLAGRPKTLPRGDAPQSAAIQAVPSRGKEALCVIASSQPISLGSGHNGSPQLVFRSAPRKVRAKVTDPRPDPSTAISDLCGLAVDHPVPRSVGP